ncbi:MAG: hypothetical protein FJ197_11020 [Gammaproteobacteria bacterium]|nr:hypothetical protein [Gammaproteobacteria bacterium]
MTDETPTGVARAMKEPAKHSIFLPALLIALAVAGWSAFQTWQLIGERRFLSESMESQQPQIEQSEKVREALQKLSGGLNAIARSGNANATVVVEQLRRQGITFADEPALSGDGSEAAADQ